MNVQVCQSCANSWMKDRLQFVNFVSYLAVLFSSTFCQQQFLFALAVERQIKLKIRVFLKINCHNIRTYSSQNLSVNISHIRGLKALKQLTQVNCSFTSTFNNDYHYELPISALKKNKLQNNNKKPTILSFLLMPKQQIMAIIIKTIMTMILTIIIIIIVITKILMTEN